jgi:hypothetical protein
MSYGSSRILDRYSDTPALSEALSALDDIKTRGPEAASDYEHALDWLTPQEQRIGHALSWSESDIQRIVSSVEWLERQPEITRHPSPHEAICELHRQASPHERPHHYRREGGTHYRMTPLFVCPHDWAVPGLMSTLLRVVGDALLHLNIAAIHPFREGNSRLRLVWGLTRSRAVAHHKVCPFIIKAALGEFAAIYGPLTKSGLSSSRGYRGQLQATLGVPDPLRWDPVRSTTGWVEWFAGSELRLHVAAGLMALRESGR